MVEKPSIFAKALRSLLEDTSRFDRAGWCNFLSVSSSAISQWLSDETIPKADILRMIIGELERTAKSEYVNATPLEAFRMLYDQPAELISPKNGARFGHTLGFYLMKPLKENFLEMLEIVPARDQELILRGALTQVGRARSQGPDYALNVQMNDLLVKYPSGSRLSDYDLLDFFCGPRWLNITVVGQQPLELGTQHPLSRAVSPALVTALVKKQLHSHRHSQESGSFTYVLPKDHDPADIEQIQYLFWGPPGCDPSAPDLKPYILKATTQDVADALRLGESQDGIIPNLIVLLDVGAANKGFAYAWFIRTSKAPSHSEEHGIVLSREQVASLASRLNLLKQAWRPEEVPHPEEVA